MEREDTRRRGRWLASRPAVRLPWHELQAIRPSDPRKYRLLIYQQEESPGEFVGQGTGRPLDLSLSLQLVSSSEG